MATEFTSMEKELLERAMLIEVGGIADTLIYEEGLTPEVRRETYLKLQAASTMLFKVCQMVTVN